MSSPKLAELQTWFQWAIAHPDGVAKALEQSDHTEPRSRCLEFVNSSGPLSHVERLQLYSNAYILRLRDVLEKDFPITYRLIGGARFPLIVEQYLNAHPPTSINIGEVGRKWPKFLERHPLSEFVPYLSEVASIEWVIGTTYYSNCLPALNPESLKDIPIESWETATFTLDPTLRFFESKWAVDRVWDDDYRNAPDPLPELLRKQSHIIVYRTEESGIRIKSVSNAQNETLRLIQSGTSLGEALDSVELEVNEDTAQLMSWFSTWILDGIIRRVLVTHLF